MTVPANRTLHSLLFRDGITDMYHRDARKKYPYGYPHDEPGDKFVPVHRCHECRTKFPRGAADGTECSKCAHTKCTSCPRVKPKKVDPYLNPDKMQELQARLAGLKVDDL